MALPSELFGGDRIMHSNIPDTNPSNLIDTSSLNQEKIDLFWRMERTNETMYVTGKAGAGKSYLLDFFVKHTRKSVAVVAPTGVAALNVGGQTIHSFFGLELAVQDLDKIRKEGVYGKRQVLMRNIDTLVIDEASMVRVDVLDAIDLKLQLANGNSLPFGGKQVILFGDLYQLPPVVEPQVDRYLEDKYGSVFFFAAPVFRRTVLNFYELKTVFRQNDIAFVGILNDIRTGNVTENELAALNSRYGLLQSRSVHDRFVTLTPKNETAARINQQMLDQLPRQEYTYNAIINGDFKQSSYPTEPALKLKVGAQVMMLVNDTADSLNDSGNRGRRWVNGTLGVISELSESSIKVMINKVEHSIDRHEWTRNQYEYDATQKKLVARPVATFKQFPVRLAWALTIHKAQGQTYQSVAVDLDGGAFAAGQTYVALSRCVALENLYLATPIQRKDIIVNQEVVNFMGKNEDFDSGEARVYDASVDGELDGASVFENRNDDYDYDGNDDEDDDDEEEEIDFSEMYF